MEILLGGWCVGRGKRETDGFNSLIDRSIPIIAFLFLFLNSSQLPCLFFSFFSFNLSFSPPSHFFTLVIAFLSLFQDLLISILPSPPL